jgi:hypothetical protein
MIQGKNIMSEPNELHLDQPATLANVSLPTPAAEPALPAELVLPDAPAYQPPAPGVLPAELVLPDAPAYTPQAVPEVSLPPLTDYTPQPVAELKLSDPLPATIIAAPAPPVVPAAPVEPPATVIAAPAPPVVPAAPVEPPVTIIAAPAPPVAPAAPVEPPVTIIAAPAPPVVPAAPVEPPATIIAAPAPPVAPQAPVPPQLPPPPPATAKLAAPKDRGIAIILEVIGGLFGLLGMGWIYAGKTERGLVILVMWLLGNLVALVGDALLQCLICIHIPLALAAWGISVYQLLKYTRRNPDLFD